MPALLNSKPTDFFVSYLVITQNSNIFGHAALVLSHCDYSKQIDPREARVEISAGIGLYSTRSSYIPCSPFAPFGQGHVKIEKESILLESGITHKTWRITAEQQQVLLQQINEDRRLPHKKPQRWHDNHQNQKKPIDNPGGPYFNIMTQSCKIYALNKLHSIGIKVGDLRKTSGNIARLSGELDFFEAQRENENRIYWKSPLYVEEVNQQQLKVILNNINDIRKMLDAKINKLKTQPYRSIPIVKIEEAFTKYNIELNVLKNQLLFEAKYPMRVDDDLVRKGFERLVSITQDCRKEIITSGYNPSWIDMIMDNLKIILMAIQKWFTIEPRGVLSEEGVIASAEGISIKGKL